MLAVAVGGGHAGVDVDPAVGVVRVNHLAKHSLRIRTLAAAPGVPEVLCMSLMKYRQERYLYYTCNCDFENCDLQNDEIAPHRHCVMLSLLF